MIHRSTAPRLGRRLAGVLLAGAVVLAACGDDDDAADSTAATETTAASAPTSSGGASATTDAPTDGSSATTAPAEDPRECESGDDPAAVTTEATTADSTDTTDSTESVVATTASGFGRPGAPGTTAPSADGGEVVVSAILEPTSLDLVTVAGAAIDQALLDNVYETLVRVDDEGAFQPGLAELPEVSGNGTIYTFTLQDGVTFHSGEPMTSADVKWSLDALRAPNANEVERLASIETVEAPDDHTVVVTLCHPDNDYLWQMSQRGGAVLQANATDLAATANGTGPFTFVEWRKGASISLARNDDYWGAKPAISGVTFQYFTDQNAMVNAFTTDAVDIVTGINSDLVGPLQENDDYVVNEGTTNGEFTLGFNNAKEPFTDPAVRKAIRQAIDKEGFRELNDGFGTIIGGPVPPTDPWFDDLNDTAPYDPEAAKAAIEAAGYPDGFEVTLTWPNLYRISLAEYVASQLAEVGITVEIQPVEFAVWLEQVYKQHDYDMTAVNHVEPRDIVNYANPDYYWQYDSPEVQELINSARVNPDPAEAVEQLREAARQISEDSPADWLILAADITVSRPHVTGYPTNDTGSRFDASGITVGS